jgi:4-alpha-glucanotransferase
MLSSHADTVIFPIQDLLVYGADTRMNTPGTSEENWQYRITEDQLDTIDREKYRYLNMLYGR